jgi:hypothetical protein
MLVLSGNFPLLLEQCTQGCWCSEAVSLKFIQVSPISHVDPGPKSDIVTLLGLVPTSLGSSHGKDHSTPQIY